MKYKEKLEEAKKLYASANADQKYVLESLFPELAELKDETLRKNLIKAFNTVGGRYWGGLEVRKILTWLEKQDDNTYSWKPTEEQYGALDYAYNSCPDTERGNYYEGVLETLIEDLHKLSEKQGEQKPDDKVEPKFHEGDWVVLTAGELSTTLQIVSVDINKKLYWFNDSSYLPIVDEQCLHHWTIQNAKDGNVLVVENRPFIYNGKVNPLSIGGYCGIDIHNIFKVYEERPGYGSKGWTEFDGDIYPATKEQCNALMKAMTDAGYEWDTEKKELKKIEQSKLTEFEDAVKDLMNTYRDAIGDCDATTEEVKKHAAYMLSLIPLKPTVEWKPSEEQMDALESAVSSLQSSTLETLYQDLKREKNHE